MSHPPSPNKQFVVPFLALPLALSSILSENGWGWGDRLRLASSTYNKSPDQICMFFFDRKHILWPSNCPHSRRNWIEFDSSSSSSICYSPIHEAELLPVCCWLFSHLNLPFPANLRRPPLTFLIRNVHVLQGLCIHHHLLLFANDSSSHSKGERRAPEITLSAPIKTH